MSLLNQKTLKNSVQFNGVGLHNGKFVNLSIKPSEPDTGIVFKRVDLKYNNLVYPSFLNVSNTSLNTTISNDFTNAIYYTCSYGRGCFFYYCKENEPLFFM